MKRKTQFVLVLPALCAIATSAWATPLQPDEIDSLLGEKQELSRQEAATLIAGILSEADAEIERTAQEAAKEVAATDAGEIAFRTSLAESMKKENERLARTNLLWKNGAIMEATVILGQIALFALWKNQ